MRHLRRWKKLLPFQVWGSAVLHLRGLWPLCDHTALLESKRLALLECLLTCYKVPEEALCFNKPWIHMFQNVVFLITTKGQRAQRLPTGVWTPGQRRLSHRHLSEVRPYVRFCPSRSFYKPWTFLSWLTKLICLTNQKFYGVPLTLSLVWHRAITLENQLVILATTAGDTGAYYAQAVNERNGENKTSPLIHLSIASEFWNSKW